MSFMHVYFPNEETSVLSGNPTKRHLVNGRAL